MSQITIITSDNLKTTVDKNIIMLSKVIQNQLEETIELPNLTQPVLMKCIEYCQLHYNDKEYIEIEKPLPSDDLKLFVSEEDFNLININNNEELFEIILAANYLDIKGLLDLGCAKVASMMKNKNADQIRNLFNIPNDFTPEEEQQIREENKWAEDALN